MATRCKKCGRPVEPTEKAMESKICGYCAGTTKDKQECFDGSPCTERHQNCNKCSWLGFSG